MKPAIRVQGLGKRHRIDQRHPAGHYRTLCETLSACLAAPWRWRRRPGAVTPTNEFWALKDVSFQVNPGEVVGVIGRNGAGKSTLLKILSRITRPTEGAVDITGRVGSLLEVGTGFHPELTGRENIFLNGGVLGMQRREIQASFDEIIEFAGVERFLDTPVKRYSSGMYIRLAFAVAAHLNPEILLVDEVLSVGDLAFQAKCLDRMGKVAREGRTILFVSHNMPAIQSLCDRALLLQRGELVCDSDVATVVESYIQSLRASECQANRAVVDLRCHPNRSRTSRPMMSQLRMLDAGGIATTDIAVGSGISFELRYQNPQRLSGLGFAIFLCTDNGQRLAMLHSHVQSQLTATDESEGVVRCHVPDIPLLPGVYRIDLSVGTWCDVLDYVEQATTITILPSDHFGTGRLPTSKQGLLALHADWSSANIQSCDAVHQDA